MQFSLRLRIEFFSFVFCGQESSPPFFRIEFKANDLAFPNTSNCKINNSKRFPPAFLDTVVEHVDKGYTGHQYVTTSVLVVDYDEGGEPSKTSS